MAIRVSVRQFYECVAINEVLSRDGTDGRTDLVYKRHVFISGALRNQRRTSSIKRMEFVCQDRLKSVAKWLEVYISLNNPS